MDSIYCLSLALKHIESNLKEKLELEELADIANYSAWHFHRLFTSHVGYGVSDYIRRRRLSEAGRELIYTHKTIVQIANDYQFESQEAFTRSFKNFAGITPGLIRKQKGPLIHFSPINLNQYVKHFRKGDTIMTQRFEHKDAFTVVGIARQYTMSTNTIPQLWDDFMARSKEVKHALYEAALGVCYYEPNYDSAKDTPFTYMAGWIVTKAEDIPQGMTSHTVAANDYAVFEHIGALDTLQKTYDHIFREWLPTSGYEMAANDDFEWYDERFKFGEADSVMEIWIPIKKK
jgi:AraC family transcriptional regulator